MSARRLAVIVVVGVLGATLVVPAGATAPERSDTFVVDLSGTDPCEEFDIVSSGTLTVRVTVFFDNAGAPVKVHVYASRDQTLTNSVSGKAIALRGHVLVVVDLTTGWETWLGQVIMSTERGVGHVIQDTGRIVFDADFNLRFIAAPHDGLTSPEVVCASLA